jgi:hypothetical protein
MVHMIWFAWNERANHVLEVHMKRSTTVCNVHCNLKKSNFRCFFRVSIYKKARNGFILGNWWENKKKNFKICILHIVLQVANNLESYGLFWYHTLPFSGHCIQSTSRDFLWEYFVKQKPLFSLSMAFSAHICWFHLHRFLQRLFILNWIFFTVSDTELCLFHCCCIWIFSDQNKPESVSNLWLHWIMEMVIATFCFLPTS